MDNVTPVDSAWVKTQLDNLATRIALVFAKNKNLPTKLGDLTNDEGFITSAVENLSNYYTKSQTYTKDEIASLVASISTMTLEPVEALPTENISTTTIYLVPKESLNSDNAFTEYVYISGKWEKIGETDINLSGYVTSDQLSSDLENYVSKDDFETENIDFSEYFTDGDGE